ncbi:MAG TPA: hypothetical protein VFQ91_11470 [Bryobacteraceae bacterium]|nr:hypothetical protein [Bryobacteraceae bacterium]
MTDDDVCPHGVGGNNCANVIFVQGRSHSLSDYTAFHLALIAFLCGVMVFLSGSSPSQMGGAGSLARQTLDRVEQMEASHPPAVPIVPLEIGSEEDVLEEVVELAETTDDDYTDHWLLPLDVAAFGLQTGRYEWSADQALALTPFRLRAFSNRGSPVRLA